jgi:replicative DNA helicase
MSNIINLFKSIVTSEADLAYARKVEEAALIRRLDRAMKHYGVRSDEAMAIEAELAKLDVRYAA